MLEYLSVQCIWLKSFSKGSTWWMIHIHFYRSNLFWLFASRILRKLNPGLFLRELVEQMQRMLQPRSLFGRWLLYFVLQLEISHLHITSHISFVEVFKYPQIIWFRKFCLGNKLGKYAFLCFLKKDLFLIRGKYKWILPKNM